MAAYPSPRQRLPNAILFGSVTPLLVAMAGFLIYRRELRAGSPLADLFALLAAIVAVAVLVVGHSVVSRLRRRVRQQLSELAEIAESAGKRKDLSTPWRKLGDNDIDRVIEGFNTLFARIAERERALEVARDEVARGNREHTLEQARFRTIFENAPVGISWMVTGRIDTRIVNPEHVRITGVPAEQMQDLRRYREATHPEDREKQDALHVRLLAGEIDHYQVEKRYIHPDGSVRWVALTVRFCRGSGTDARQEINTIVDITERRRAEAELVKASRLLEILMENSGETIYFKDRDSRFVHYSRAFTTRFGLAGPRPLDGKTDFDLFTPEHAQPAFDDEQAIVRTGRPLVGRLEKETYPDGRVTWALTSKLPWRDERGEIIGTFGVSKDVTAVKEAEAKLEETHRQLLEVSRQAGMAEVATGVLHNVGNVLNSINVSSTLIADQVKNSRSANVGKLAALLIQNQERLAEFLTNDPRGQKIPAFLESLGEALADERNSTLAEIETLRRNVEHIKEIVAMQQAYASTVGAIETVSLPDLVEDALRINAGSLARHEVNIVRQYEARGVITTDRHKVIQILINLVRNAKYACDESGKEDKCITVRTTADREGIKISVIDNGVGIPQENLTRIFVHGFTTRKKGHGFGLHTSAIAAKELGGSLSALSGGPGEGASFILALPRMSERTDASEPTDQRR